MPNGFQLPLSPRDQIRQQLIGNLLAGQRRPPSEPGSGLASALGSIGGALLQKGLNKEQGQRQQEFQAGLGNVLESDDLLTALASEQNQDVRNLLGPLLLEQRLNQKQQQGFTLSPGQARFGAEGEEIASLPTAAPKKTDIENLLDAAGITAQADRSKIISGILEKRSTQTGTTIEFDEAGRPRVKLGVPQKQAEAAKKEAGRRETARNAAKTVVESTQKAIDQAGITTSGFLGKISSFIPGTPGFDRDKTIDTIKANVAFDRLQQMRANSPTGGALGQVSNLELGLLGSVKGSLEIGQGDDQLANNLVAIRNSYAVLELVNSVPEDSILQTKTIEKLTREDISTLSDDELKVLERFAQATQGVR